MSTAGVYVHIPFCRSKCRYCDFISVCGNEDLQRRYIDALIKEINTGRKIFDGDVDTLYIGGGTPSCLFGGAVRMIADAVRDTFSCSFREFTVECNPDTFDKEKALELKAAGVSRISLGVQSFDDGVLKEIGRRHDSRTAKAAVKIAVDSGFDVSADLMLGLKGQTERDIDDFVSFMSDNGVEHISAYMLKVEEGTPLAADVKNGMILPTDDDVAKLYDHACKTLRKAGFERYETSNFCKNGKRCIHNMKYWTMCDYLAFGVAAHGKTGKRRYFNVSDIGEYITSIENNMHVYKTEEDMTTDDEISEYIMLGLRLDDGLDVAELETHFGIKFEDKFGQGLKKAAPYVGYDGKSLKIKPEYALVANSVINMFI